MFSTLSYSEVSSFSVKNSVGEEPSYNLADLGIRKLRSSTTLVGESPLHVLTFSEGLSSMAVFVPTIIAETSERSL